MSFFDGDETAGTGKSARIQNSDSNAGDATTTSVTGEKDATGSPPASSRTGTIVSTGAMHRPLRGPAATGSVFTGGKVGGSNTRGPPLSGSARFKAELAALGDDDDDDEDNAGDEGEHAPTQGRAAVGFGKRYLTSLGLKEGDALQPGGAKSAYVPKVTGGFLSTSTAAQLPAHEVKEGLCVYRIVKSTGATGTTATTPADGGDEEGGTALSAVAVVRRCSQVDKAVEVEYANGSRERLPFSQIRLASDMEQRLYENEKKALSSRKRERATTENADEATQKATAWIVPHLLVRIAQGPKEAIGKIAPVVSVDRSSGQVTLQIGAVGTVSVAGTDVSTVVPSEGDNAIFVTGFLKGQIVPVVQRKLNEGGAVAAVVVKKGNELIEVNPANICALFKSSK